LCLHGYPDTAWTWRHLGPALAARGWHVVAPFQRGYAPSGLAPDGAYQIGALAHDALTARDRFHRGGRAVLVGHDWGAIAAYAVGAARPEAFDRIVTMTVPPLGLAGTAVRGGLGAAARQAGASWYIFFQQIPGLSERVVGTVIPRLWRRWSPDHEAEESLARLEPTLADPERRTAILRYYRALLQPWYRKPGYREYQRHARGLPPGPLLYLHGSEDGCLRWEAVQAAVARFPAEWEHRLFDGAGHFLHLEAPDQVNQAILDFVGDPA
jgi:pimeloyl-ACP methyl ester carboxylesterase